jgi:predicted negative regulator of RcsB-dependent stress response
MDLDLEEQEQLAKLKGFWQDYGRWLLIGVAIAVIGSLGYWGFKTYQTKQALAASQQYEVLLEQTDKNDLPGVLSTAKKIQQEYGKTAYAGMAGLLASNLAYSVNDKEATIEQLKWVANSSSSESFQSIAKLRLSSLYIDQKTPEGLSQADQLLNSKMAFGFEALKLERRGDWYWAQDKTAEAKKSYIAAWNILSDERMKVPDAKEIDPALKKLQHQNPGPDQRLLKVKIDSLGGF